MSVCLYDRAVVNKIQNMVKNSDIHIYGPDDMHRLIEIQADSSGDKPLQLPIIAISREPNFEIYDPARSVLSMDGATVNKDENTTIKLNAIPMSLSYRLNIYTRYVEEADNYLRSILFNLINHPQVRVIVPYLNRNFEHQSAIDISSTVTDNSDIPERLIKGQFTRYTISFSIKDAYIWDVKNFDNITFPGASVEVDEQ